MQRYHWSQSKKISLKKKLGNCCKFRKFAKWPQTSPNVPIRWEIQKNSSLPNLQIFEICKIVPKIAKCINLARNMRKIRAWQILEIRKIVPTVTKCVYSWRYTEKPEFAKFENFWNLQNNHTIRQMCRFVEKHNRKIQVGDSRHLRNSQQNEKL